MREKILSMLGLMRRASAVAVGEDKTGEAVRAGKGKLLLLASDASDNARRRAESFASGRRVLLVPLPFTKEEISGAVGTAGCSMAAVTDLGFANAWMKLLKEQWPEEYGGLADTVESRHEKAARRKAEKAQAGNKSSGKRRTNV